MKRAIILHGTDGTPSDNWFPWLKAKLESEGYEVWVPQLPDSHTPNAAVYADFLFGHDWDMTDNIVIGHSSGAVEVLNLLMDQRCPRVKHAVFVGAWAGGIPNGYEVDNKQFVNLFPPDGFDFAAIRSHADKLLFLHGNDDPYCPLEQAQYLAEQLDASLTVMGGGHHLGARYRQLPELWDSIKPSV